MQIIARFIIDLHICTLFYQDQKNIIEVGIGILRSIVNCRTWYCRQVCWYAGIIYLLVISDEYYICSW